MSALEREAREAAGALTSSSSKPIVVVDDEETSASTPSASSSSSSFNLDSLSARLSELEQQAAVLATKIGRSREGETLLSRAASAREALRAARASAAPVFSLAAAAAAAVAVAGAMPEAAEEERAAAEEAEEKQQQKKKKQQDQQDAEEKASRVADAARDAARLGGLRGETLRLGGASFGRCSSPSPSSSPSSRSLPSLRLDNLADCTVVVEVPLGALVATGLTRCVVFLACPVGGGGGGRGGGGRGGGGVSEEEKTKTPGGGGGAVLIDGASASTFYLAAHQCRLHRLVDNCKVYVRSAAPPVIEACSTLKLAPYPVSTSTSTSTSTSSPSSSPSSSSSSPSSSSSSPSSSSSSSSPYNLPYPRKNANGDTVTLTAWIELRGPEVVPWTASAASALTAGVAEVAGVAASPNPPSTSPSMVRIANVTLLAPRELPPPMQPQQPQDLAPPLPEKTKQRSAEDEELPAAADEAAAVPPPAGGKQLVSADENESRSEGEELSPAQLRHQQHQHPRRALLQRGARARREGELVRDPPPPRLLWRAKRALFEKATFFLLSRRAFFYLSLFDI